MTTDEKELARVRSIHRNADRYADRISDYGTRYEKFCVDDGPANVWWTRAEIEAWPATKAKMLAELTEHTPSPMVFVSTHAPCPVQHGPVTVPHFGCQEAVARGLVMYREMLPAAVTPAPVEGGKSDDGREECATCHIRSLHTVNGVCGPCYRASRKPAPKSAEPIKAFIPDKYEQHRNNLVDRLRRDGRWEPGKARDVLTAAAMELENNARDEWKQAQTGDRQLSPRERLVAGIRSEFDTSSAERRRLAGKVHEGRNSRVYRSNDR